MKNKKKIASTAKRVVLAMVAIGVVGGGASILLGCSSPADSKPVVPNAHGIPVTAVTGVVDFDAGLIKVQDAMDQLDQYTNPQYLLFMKHVKEIRLIPAGGSETPINDGGKWIVLIRENQVAVDMMTKFYNFVINEGLVQTQLDNAIRLAGNLERRIFIVPSNPLRFCAFA